MLKQSNKFLGLRRQSQSCSSNTGATLNGEAGKGEIALVFIVVLGGAFFLLGLPVIGFYYSKVELEGLIQFQAKKALNREDAKIRTLITREMRNQNINAEPDDLIIDRGSDEMRISLSWEEVLALDFGDYFYKELHVFEFDIEESHKMSGHQ